MFATSPTDTLQQAYAYRDYIHIPGPPSNTHAQTYPDTANQGVPSLEPALMA